MSLYPTTKHPYYIVCPGYTRRSAGIKALYLLCHHLNVSGHAAYIVTWPWSDLEVCRDFKSDLLTPLLTKTILDRHIRNGTYPITLYNESLPGDPFHAPCIARFYGNFPELLGGGAISDNELNFGYSKVLADAIGSPDNVLFIPTVDTSVFFPGETGGKRKGTCFYAGKFKEIHFGTTFDITKDGIEITRQTHIWSPEMIAQTFRTCELFYAYENTMLITEAVICGCPTVILPNPYMTASIAKVELGDYGVAWGNTPDQVQYARDTVHQGWEKYNQSLKLFPAQLASFIEKTQAYAERTYKD